MEEPNNYLVKVVLLFQIAAHAWILFGHRQVLGSTATDRSSDKLFSKSKMIASFIWLMGLHFIFFLKASLQGQPAWIGILLACPSFSRLQFLAFQEAAWADLVGLILFSTGIFLRLWAIRTLGRFFTFEIGIRSEHRIVKSGPYRWLRHPSYTGYLLLLLGVGVSLKSGLFLLLTWPTALIFLLLRIQNEEQMLHGHFGQEFEEYQKHSKKLIPGIY